MENSKSKFGLNAITGIVVMVVVLIMIMTKVSEVKKENLDSRQGTNSGVSK
jgi:hypothetical protein